MSAQVQPISGSSFIAGVGYDADTQELTIQFTNGKQYQHDGVPEGVFQEFVSAGSMGQYWHANIKNNYPARPRR